MATSQAARRQENEMSGMVENLQGMGNTAKRAVSDGYEAVRDRAGDYLEQGKEKAREYSEVMQSRVRDEPVKAIAIAAGVGFLFGILLARR